jgi:putative transposase
MFQLIKELSTVYPVEKMCQVFCVSRSGFYEWNGRGPSQREQEDMKILEVMNRSHDACQGMCGLDKIWADVREKHPKCSRKRAYRLQSEHGLYSVRKKPFKIATTDSNHKLPVAENLLNREFKIDKPNAVWVADITQFDTLEGALYLATMKDIFQKEIVGWSLADHMRTELCTKALENAVMKHRPPKGLMHHSDRGSQYCSKDYQEALKTNGMICSMSRKGNCWDNACAETFFSTIKSERLRYRVYKTREEARQDIFWYIECFYNRKRRHQALGNMTPEAFKQQYYKGLAAQAIKGLAAR